MGTGILLQSESERWLVEKGMLDCGCEGEAETVKQIKSLFEPAHEIMALFVLCNLILQSRMHSHPLGLDVCFLVRPFGYFHTSCVRTAMALARLCGCAGSPETSLVAYVISTKISCAGSLDDNFREKFPYFFMKMWILIRIALVKFQDPS